MNKRKSKRLNDNSNVNSNNKKNKIIAEEIIIKEVEEEIDCEPINLVHTTLKGNRYYTQLVVKDITVKIGSFIEVETEKKNDNNDSDNDDNSDNEYAQILGIFQDIDLDDEVFLEVRWFYKPNQVSEYKIKRKGIKLLSNELVETELIDDIPAGSIIKMFNIFEFNNDVNVTKNGFITRYIEKKSSNSIQKVLFKDIFERGISFCTFQDEYSSYFETFANNSLSSDIYSTAIRSLHISVLPDSLPCRSKETSLIQESLIKALKSKNGSKPIYIGGLPGTGKTATVKSTISYLMKQSKKSNEIPVFEFVEINCLRLSNPMDAYSALYRSIVGYQVSGKKAQNYLVRYFDDRAQSTNQNQDQTVTICLLDELDFLLSGAGSKDVMYNFFNWTTFNNSCLVVVGISNVFNLPEILQTRVSSRITVNRIVFSPYDHDQITEIIKTRLKELSSSIIDQTKLELLSRKASQQTGDLRAALKICQKSIEILRDVPNRKITDRIDIKIINQAVNEYRESPIMASIRKCCLLDKLIIIALCNFFKKGEIEIFQKFVWIEINDLINKIIINNKTGKDVVNLLWESVPIHFFEDAIVRLCQQGLIKREYYKDGTCAIFKSPKLSLGLEYSDIKIAFSDDSLLKFCK